MNLFTRIFTLILALVLISEAYPQAGSAVKITPGAGGDSISKSEYPYLLPFFGKKIQKRGFKMPYPAGIMINSFVGTQEIKISDLQVGFNGGEMFGLDSIVNFSDCKAHLQNINLRFDTWILPFLNIYGIVGKTWAQTEISLSSPVILNTEAKFQGDTFGGGATLASGINNYFFTLDYNVSWSNFDKIDGLVSAQMLSARAGYSFKLGADRNIAVWVVGSRIYLNKITTGTINLGDIIPDFTGEKLDPIITSSKSDYPDMSLAQYEIMKDAAQALYDNLPAVNDRVDKTIISYSLKKRPIHNFTGSIGAQYQPNRRYQFRTEVGLIGGRTSLLLSANYRFGIVSGK